MVTTINDNSMLNVKPKPVSKFVHHREGMRIKDSGNLDFHRIANLTAFFNKKRFRVIGRKPLRPRTFQRNIAIIRKLLSQ